MGHLGDGHRLWVGVGGDVQANAGQRTEAQHVENGEITGIVVVSDDLRRGADAAQHHRGLQGAVDLIRRSYAEPLEVAQLERAMRRALGVSPKQLLIRTRIEEAARRLDDTEASLATIASACGFYDQSSFTRQFQRAVGITPGGYRAHQQRR